LGDSASLAKLGDTAFTAIHIEDSDYARGDQVTRGARVTTRERFDIDGHQISRSHTAWL